MASMYTLRYIAGAPPQPRPHKPTEAKFVTHQRAFEHLLAQPNADVLEVVER